MFNGKRWQRGPYIVLKSNWKSVTASSFMWFPPYFYIRFGSIRCRGSFIAVFGRPLQLMVPLCYRIILLSVVSVLSGTLVYCGQTVGWMVRVPVGMEVGLGPGDIVLDGNPAISPRKRAQQPHTFWAMSIVAKRSPISATAELLFA